MELPLPLVTRLHSSTNNMVPYHTYNITIHIITTSPSTFIMKKSICILTIGGVVVVGASSFYRRDRLFAADGKYTGWGRRTRTSIHQRHRKSTTALILFQRGGDTDSAVLEEEDVVQTLSSSVREQTLDDRVSAAMKRLGLEVEEELTSDGSVSLSDNATKCEGGVCTMPDNSTIATNTDMNGEAVTEQDINNMAEAISIEMNVPRDIALAAIYSSFTGSNNNRINEEAARCIVQAEVSAIANVAEDSPEVQQLVSEGFDVFFARRSLAFSGMDIDNARAILIADAEDEQAELEAQQASAAAAEKPAPKTVTVDYPANFDPLSTAAAAITTTNPTPHKQQEQKPPPPAKKEDVVFECTSEDIQKLVIESPVPVLLDVYADWCGPCKQLTPALEQIVINAGGMLRLCKVNTDQQRQISSALEVKALPTIYGVKDGRILNMFQGFPRDEQMLRNFLMGLLVPGQPFKPPVTAEEKANYDQLSAKLLKVAAASSFSFSARERLQGKVAKSLDELVSDIGGETGMAVADDSARVLRSLMSNIIKDPFEEKYRRVNLANKAIGEKVAKFAPCIAILKNIGFVPDGDAALVVGKGKRVVNIAPINVARDCIDKWVDQNRYNIAASARKRKDEVERARLAAEAEEAAKNNVDEEEEDESEEEEVDPNLCIIKYRIEGKKKLHDVNMDANDTLNTLLEKLELGDGESVQFTCAAKRLIVKSTDEEKMSKTMKELRLMPAASIVIKIGEGKSRDVTKGSLAERNSAQKKKTGSHSMHSIGLYSQNDGNKAETFESGGVLYDHDISDDDEEEENDDDENNSAEGEVDEE
jgi:thiol-disulfide isomerase/thioredoxin